MYTKFDVERESWSVILISLPIEKDSLAKSEVCLTRNLQWQSTFPIFAKLPAPNNHAITLL
jgi:hypothetical protein